MSFPINVENMSLNRKRASLEVTSDFNQLCKKNKYFLKISNREKEIFLETLKLWFGSHATLILSCRLSYEKQPHYWSLT